MSRRARLRQQARPWQSKPDQETPIPWEAIAQDRERREQPQPQPKGQQ